MKINLFILFFFLLTAVGCNFSKKERISELNQKLITLNEEFNGKSIGLEDEIYSEVFEDNKLRNSKTILVYYDANCHVCFKQLTKWKPLISYFESIDKTISIKFVLFSNDIEKTQSLLKKTDFSDSYVIYDTNRTFLGSYGHLDDKAYNTMLLDENKQILFIGSPLLSDNLKKYYTKLITNK